MIIANPLQVRAALRRQVARRGQLVRHKTRLKNEVQSVCTHT
jgi:transposase